MRCFMDRLPPTCGSINPTLGTVPNWTSSCTGWAGSHSSRHRRSSSSVRHLPTTSIGASTSARRLRKRRRSRFSLLAPDGVRAYAGALARLAPTAVFFPHPSCGAACGLRRRGLGQSRRGTAFPGVLNRASPVDRGEVGRIKRNQGCWTGDDFFRRRQASGTVHHCHALPPVSGRLLKRQRVPERGRRPPHHSGPS